MSSLLPYLCQYGSMDSCFIQWVIIQYHHYLFWCSECPRFGDWELLQAGFCTFFFFFFFNISCHSFFGGRGVRTGHLGTFLWHKVVQLNLDFPSPSPGLNHFTKEPWFFLVGVILEPKIWKLGVLIATKVSWLMTAFSVDRLAEIAISHHPCFSSLYVCSSFLSLQEPWLPTRSVYSLFCSILKYT